MLLSHAARNNGFLIAIFNFCWGIGFLLFAASQTQADALSEGQDAYIKADYAQAFLLLQPLAEQGVAPAQFTLAEMYRRGRGFTRSVPEALPLYEQAAQAGHTPAMNTLGMMYEAGDGVVQDLDKAAAWFKQAADKGDALGKLNLALHYIRVEERRDFEQAAHWFHQAAEQGHAEAQYFLARLMLDGKGVAQQREAAMDWLKRAGAQGHVAAQRFLQVYNQPESADRELALRDLKRTLAVGVGRIDTVSNDADYGYSQSKPIKTGLGYETEWRYLNALRGPKGEVVHYRWLGRCCEHETEAALRGKGFIDRYELTYDGLDKPVVLYLNMFESGPTLAPLGLSFTPTLE